MIVFDLECRVGGHRFEGWFGSSEDFLRQQERGLVSCPQCGAVDVVKAPMAPNLARKGNQSLVVSPEAPAAVSPAPAQAMAPAPSLPPQAREMMMALARMQAEALKTSRWVGKTFVEDARAMHYGEKPHEAIHGQASADEARELFAEGIEVAPVLFPISPPDEVN